MENKNFNIAENYYSIIKNLSPDVKLELISKISESLKTQKKEGVGDDSWKKLYGAWQSEKSAEEIIDEIRSSRYTNREIENWIK